MAIYQGPNCPPDRYGPAAAAVHTYCQKHAGGRLDRYVVNYSVTINNVADVQFIGNNGLRISMALSGGNEDRACSLFVTTDYKMIDAPGACSCDA